MIKYSIKRRSNWNTSKRRKIR